MDGYRRQPWGRSQKLSATPDLFGPYELRQQTVGDLYEAKWRVRDMSEQDCWRILQGSEPIGSGRYCRTRRLQQSYMPRCLPILLSPMPLEIRVTAGILRSSAYQHEAPLQSGAVISPPPRLLVRSIQNPACHRADSNIAHGRTLACTGLLFRQPFIQRLDQDTGFDYGIFRTVKN